MPPSDQQPETRPSPLARPGSDSGRRSVAASFASFLALVPFGTIWGLVWPQTVMMLCTLVIGLTDVWVAGRIDSGVQAALGLSGQIQAFMMVIGMALGSAAIAAVSQSMGAGRRRRGQRYAGLVIALATLIAVALAVMAFFLRDPLINLMRVPENVRPLTRFFYGLMLLALPAQYVMLVGSMLFRATRNVMMPLLVAGVACVINVLGDLGFGLGWFGLPAYGAAGIGWSTFTAVLLAGLLTLGLLRRCHLFLPAVLPPVRWVRKAAPYLLRVALPAMLSQLLWQAGYMTLFGITAALPGSAVALAGMTAGMRIESILFMPGAAFNATAAILTGNLLGAGDKAGAKRIGLATVGTGVVIMSLVAACMWPFMPELARTFSPESLAVRDQIVWYLTFNILSTPFTVGGMILNGVMSGAGATIYALVINTACIWLVRLPLAWFLSHILLGGEARGVYMAMLLSMAVQACAMLWVFWRHDWSKYAMRRCSSPSIPGDNKEAASDVV